MLSHVFSRSTSFIVIIVLVACASSALRAAPPQASSSTNMRDALALYEGSWKVLNNDQYKGFAEVCTWLSTREPRRHIVCRATHMTSDGQKESLGIYTFDEATHEYVNYDFGSGGATTARGQRISNGFRYFSERVEQGQRVQERFTLTETSSGRFHTLLESSTAGGPWQVESELDWQRTRP